MFRWIFRNAIRHQQRPAAASMSWPPGLLAALSAFRIKQRSEIVEPVGCHDSCRRQFPECIFDLGLQMARDASDIDKETGSAFLQHSTNILGHGREYRIAIDCRSAF